MNKFILIFLCILFSLNTLAKQPPAISTGGANLNIIFLVDNSGSMGNKYTQVRDALRKLMANKSLASQANFSLLTWGSRTCSWRGSYADCPRRTYYTPVYGYRNFCYNYNCRWRYNYSSRRWEYSCNRYCYQQRYVIRYNYTYRYQYYFVPLNKDKVANYNAMMQGINEVDADGGGTNVASPMTFVQQYVNSSEYQKNIVNDCDQTIVIVMSDGIWSGDYQAESAARNLYQTKGIKTFAVAFGTDNNYYKFRNLATAGKTYPDPGALGGWSVNSNDLANTFMEAIRSVNFDSYTAVAPTVLPDTNVGDLLLTPEFKYEADKQWIGKLKAKKINQDGSIGSLAWEFGQNLDRTHPDSRRIWTAAAGLPTPTQSNRIRNPNNMLWNSSSYVSRFASLMETGGNFTNSAYYDAYYLLRFIRGYDSFGENTNSAYRWKLNDIYNSQPIYVSQPADPPTDVKFAGGKKYFVDKNPSAFSQYKSRQRAAMVYAGTNGGLVHAIDAKTGYEKWAFMPPPLLNKMSDVITSTRNTSNSIYGVDGALVAEDVYVNGQWRTYLAIALGDGGRGFSVIDVTDPEYPAHVFSIENYEDINGTRRTKKWDSAGNLSTVSGYEKLGFTTSAPIFTYVKDGRTYEPVLVIGGGSSQGGMGSLSNPVGNTVYTISLKSPGSVIDTKNLDADDNRGGSTVSSTVQYNWCCNSDRIFVRNPNAFQVGCFLEATGSTGSYLPQNTYVTRKSGNQLYINNRIYRSYYGDTISCSSPMPSEVKANVEVLESGTTPYMNGKYGFRMLVPNNSGIIDSFDDTGSTVTNVINNSTFERVISSLGRSVNDRVIQKPISVSNFVADSKDELNVTYGTGDMDNLSLMNKSPDNKIISIQNTEADFFTENKNRKANWLAYQGIMSYYNKAKKWLGFERENYTFFDATYQNAPSCKSNVHEGWFVSINGLRAYDKNGSAKTCQNGKLATNIETYGGATIAGVYIPKVASGVKNACSIGDSAITFRDAKCGTEITRGVYLYDTLIGGLTAYKENVYISISGKSTTGTVDSQGKFKQSENVIYGKPGFSLSNSGNEVEVESMIRMY